MNQCASYDAVKWESDYKSGLNGTALTDYESLTGSAKSAQWNPDGCNTAYFDNYTVSEWYDESSGLDRTTENEWVMGCNAQNEILNRFFTIGTSCLSGSTMLYGLIMDKYGRRWLRIAGTLAFAISCVLFSLASIEPRGNRLINSTSGHFRSTSGQRSRVMYAVFNLIIRIGLDCFTSCSV